MADFVRHLRESATYLSTFVGQQGMSAVDLTSYRWRTFDGSTAGGYPHALLADLAGLLNSASLQTVLPGGGINKVRNGRMTVAQRGTSGTVSASATAYTLDGIMVSAVGASLAWSQVWNANLPGMALRLTSASGLSGSITLRIESYLAAQLLTAAKAAQPVTAQFTIYNNTGIPVTPQISSAYATAQDNFASVTADLAASNVQTVAAATVETLAYTFTPSVNLANGYQITLNFGAALSSGSYIDISLADIRATPGLSTGINNSPPPPEARDSAHELLLCQRYYEVLGFSLVGSAYTSSAIAVSGGYKATKRATPVLGGITLLTTSPVFVQFGIGTFTGSSSAISAHYLGSDGLTLGINGFSGMTSGLQGAVDTQSLIGVSVEL